jgi:tetratricopeptide (TPR) repeat protein
MFSIFLYKLFWSAEVWYNKGCAFDKLGKYEEAIKCYDKATDIDPEYINAWTCKSLALCKQGKYKKAIKCCDKALKIDPNNADAQIYKEEALKVLGNKGEQIIYDPEMYEYLNNKGTVLYDQGKYEEAIKGYVRHNVGSRNGA